MVKIVLQSQYQALAQVIQLLNPEAKIKQTENSIELQGETIIVYLETLYRALQIDHVSNKKAAAEVFLQKIIKKGDIVIKETLKTPLVIIEDLPKQVRINAKTARLINALTKETGMSKVDLIHRALTLYNQSRGDTIE